MEDELGRVLEETRQRFIARFPDQCDAIDLLIDEAGAPGAAGAPPALREAVHRVAGLAGTVGFPGVSERAAELETLALADRDFDPARAHRLVADMRDAFDRGLADRAAGAAPMARAKAAGATILLAEDDPDQRAILAAHLTGRGYRCTTVASGDLVQEAARRAKPALILLDAGLPGLDGYAVCRLLKADPDFAGIPVMFLTTGASADDRLAALTLGADEFLHKPVDMRELALRIERLLNPRQRPPLTQDSPAAALAYDVFLEAARAELRRGPAALAMVRVPPDDQAACAAHLAADMRARDVIGVYGPARLLILMPGMTAPAAMDRLRPSIEALLAQPVEGICAGLAASAGGRSGPEALIIDADEALVRARFLHEPVAVWAETAPSGAVAALSVLIAEDDPDVAGIVDAQMRAAGYRTSIAFDGDQVMAALASEPRALLVLDLMLPKLTGFEVLALLPPSDTRPRVIVLSARGREADVTRAFELGADDYMTKPFSPQELMARVARLLR